MAPSLFKKNRSKVAPQTRLTPVLQSRGRLPPTTTPGADLSSVDGQSPQLTNPFGINILADAQISNVVADILFVHGLNGSSYTTWYHAESRTHWPSEMLPQDFQDCRILAYGYDATVASLSDGVSRSRFSDEAEKLLGHLVERRNETGSHMRKIVFVAHSLGGLLVKRAIQLSRDHTDSSLRRVEELTCGIIFLGTPHQGSAVADMARIIAHVISTISESHVTKADLRVLSTDSEVTRDLQDWFYKWLSLRKTYSKPVHVASFHEELPLKIPPKIPLKIPLRRSGPIVVSSESAKVYGDGNNYGIRADHRGIAQFPPNSQDYRLIRMQISKSIETVWGSRPGGDTITVQDSEKEEQLRKECITSLHHLHLSTRFGSIRYPSLNEGYFSWIRSCPQLRALATRASRVWWLHGKAGSAKSTVLEYLAQHDIILTELAQTFAPRRLCIAQHFFDSKVTDTPRSVELLGSILYQLLEIEPELFRYVKPKYSYLRSYQSTVSWSTKDLREVVLKIFRGLTNNSTDVGNPANKISICLLLDALDECDDQEITDILELLEEFINLESPNIVFCLSSQLKPAFSRVFGKYSTMDLKDYTEADIRLYASTKCPELANHDEKEYREVLQTVMKDANGVFLWVQLVCRALRESLDRADPIESLRKVVRDCPADLEKLYRKILDGISPRYRSEAYEILAIYVAAHRPLNLLELYCSLHRERSQEVTVADLGNLSRELETLETRISAICGGLVEVCDVRQNQDRSERMVLPLHRTARIFLLKTSTTIPFGNTVLESLKVLGHCVLFQATAAYVSLLSRKHLPIQERGFRFGVQDRILFRSYPPMVTTAICLVHSGAKQCM